MRTVDPRLAVGSIAGVVLLASLTACGGAPEPQPLPTSTSSTSPSPSSSATPTPPVMPETAGAKTKAGSIAFARGFIEALNYAGFSGDTKPLRRLYISLCTRCEAIADGIDQTYAAGGKIDGGSWHVSSVTFYTIKNEVAFVDALVDYDAQTWTKSQGAQPTEFPASKRNLKAFNLRWKSSGGWATSALDPNK